jgi:G:T-mismatch repair DNA endonuclease (very short patch repair protein)
VHDTPPRSYNRCRIRSKNTRPEMLVRKFLFANPDPEYSGGVTA